MDPKTIDELVHDLFVIGSLLVSHFVKNKNSLAEATSITNTLQTVVLPLVDTSLGVNNTPAPASPKSTITNPINFPNVGSLVGSSLAGSSNTATPSAK